MAKADISAIYLVFLFTPLNGFVNDLVDHLRIDLRINCLGRFEYLEMGCYHTLNTKLSSSHIICLWIYYYLGWWIILFSSREFTEFHVRY
jgi:hypothetical protein